jgi:glycosyltransferase involved in cell wall biosynthesis
MQILFLSISNAVSNINNRGIYPDLLRFFAEQGHDVVIICPFERRIGKKTKIIYVGNITILGVYIFNITKGSFIEKGISTLLIEYQFGKAIEKHLNLDKIDLILYSTPPITLNRLILSLKVRYNAKTYLMLKDIFPQNAVDLGVINKNSVIYKFFKKKEKKLYEISDFIGCMSPANVEYLLKNNPSISNEKVRICPNAIDLREREYDESSLFIRDKYQIPKDAVVFIFGGNLGVGQGINFFLEVLASNKWKSDRFFLVVGSGNRYKKIKEWIDANHPGNALLLSAVSRQDYEQLENASNVGLVFLDRKFTIPNFPSRILSYMECKLPLLIATDTACDLGSIAEENRFGLWAETGDLVTINKNIEKYVKDNDLRTQYGELGLAFLKSNFLVNHAYDLIMEQIGKPFRSTSVIGEF